MPEAPRMQIAVAAIWHRGLPQTRERVALLRKAADQLSGTRTIDSDLRAEAAAVAHKLAGSLGMYGFKEATEHARAIELTLDHAGLPQPERLQEQVMALESSLSPHL